MPTFKAVHLTTECTSFSRANTGKGAVRNNEHICGFPWNCDRKREKAELGNRLLAISMQLVMFCLARSIAFTLENPATSMMWMHPLVRALFLEAVGSSPNKRVHLVRTCYCRWGRPFRTRTYILTNVAALTALDRECTHKTHRMTLAGWGPSGEANTKKGNAYPMSLCRVWASILDSQFG